MLIGVEGAVTICGSGDKAMGTSGGPEGPSVRSIIEDLTWCAATGVSLASIMVVRGYTSNDIWLNTGGLTSNTYSFWTTSCNEIIQRIGLAI